MDYTVKEKIIEKILVGFRNFLKLFPLKSRYRLFENLGILGYYIIKKRRKLTIDNIKNALPEKSDDEVIKIAKESYKTMGKMVMTSLFLEEITSNGNTYLEDENFIKELSSQSEKSIILVSLHLGGFEAGSIMKNIREFYAVFRKQKNRVINDLMNKWRTEGGLNPIPLRENELLSKTIKSKTIIALASDHHGNDIEIEYFGRKTKAVSGPVVLALKNKIPLVLAYSIFENDKIKIITEKIIDIEKKENLKATIQYNMQKIYNEFENIIRKYPEQYMWQHKRWRN